MGDFGADWLGLREPADARARCGRLAERLGAWLAARAGAASGAPAAVELLDLGCGTGAGLRWLAPRLTAAGIARQRWTALDRDPNLLAALPRRSADWGLRNGLAVASLADGLRLSGTRFGGGDRTGPLAVDWTIRTRTFDLASLLADPGCLDLAPGTCLTASALIDLVSETWLDALLAAAAAARAPLLLALGYDGRAQIDPPHPLDGPVLGLVNAHQRRDKGLGPALGPSAPARLAWLAERHGFRVESETSDWVLDGDTSGLAAGLIDGWAQAAQAQAAAVPDAAMGPGTARLRDAIGEWRKARSETIRAGRLGVQVGHRDSLLLPDETNGMVRRAASKPAPNRSRSRHGPPRGR